MNKSSFMGQKNHFHYKRNCITSGSGIAGCDCINLERGNSFLKRSDDNLEKWDYLPRQRPKTEVSLKNKTTPITT